MSAAPSTDTPLTTGRRPSLDLSPDLVAWVRLLYVEENGRLFVVASDPAADWMARAVREGRAWIRLEDGPERPVTAEPTREPEVVARVHALGRDRYGHDTWDAYFRGTDEVLALDPGEAPDRLPLHTRLQREFDRAAVVYDRALEGNPVERYLKERAAALIEETVRRADRVLEIGPGTGFHTLRLLARGHRVLAVDLSPKMLDTLVARARSRGLADRLEVRELALGHIGSGLADLPSGSFGGIVSAFGAFDLEPDLDRAVPTLGRLASPGAALAFTALNRPGWGPMAWELAAGRPGAAFRRTRAVVPAGGIGYSLELHLRTPSTWDALLQDHFRRARLLPISVLSPPFRSERLLRWLGGEGATRARQFDERVSAHASLWSGAEWLFHAYVRTGPNDIAGPLRRARPRRGSRDRAERSRAVPRPPV